MWQQLAVVKAWEERTVHPRVGSGAAVSCAMAVSDLERPRRYLILPISYSAGMEATEMFTVPTQSFPDPH